jgi:hypothetical protein
MSRHVLKNCTAIGQIIYKEGSSPALQIWDVYAGSRIRTFQPGSRVKKIPDPNQRISEFLTPITVSKL